MTPPMREPATHSGTPASPATGLQDAPGPDFSARVCLLLIAMPLFALAVVLCAARNVDRFLEGAEPEIVVRALLTEGLDTDVINMLAREWRSSPHWKKVEIVPIQNAFAEMEELKDWAAESANRDLVALMPRSVDLRPVRPFSQGTDLFQLVREIESQAEVERVFFDRESFRWLKALAAGRKVLGLGLGAAFGLLAALGALLGGILGENLAGARRAAAGRPGGGARGSVAMAGSWGGVMSTGSMLTTCSGGLAAVILLGLFWAGVYFATPLEICFLSHFQSLCLIAAGLGLGLFAMQAVPALLLKSLGPSAARLLLSGLVTATGLLPVREARAAAPPPVALPDSPAAFGTGPSMSAASEADRLDLAERNKAEIAREKRVIGYLRDWINRAAEEAVLDEQNRLRSETKLSVALSERHALKVAVADGQRDAANLRTALNPGRWSPLADAAVNGARRSRRAMAEFLLARAARRSAISAKLERERLDECLSRLRKLREEEERLALFAKQAGRPREDVRKELDRHLALLQDLYLRQSVLESSPGRIDWIDALDLEAPDRPSETASLVLSESDLNPVDGVDAVDGVDERVKTYAEMGMTGMAATQGRSATASSRQLAVPRLPALPGPDRRRHQVFLTPGTLVRAVASGKVLHAGPFKRLGHTVVVEIEGGKTTVYAFLGPDIGVESGQIVKKGQILGSAGLIRNAGQSGVQFEVRDKEGEIVRLSAIPGLSASNLRRLLTGAAESAARD